MVGVVVEMNRMGVEDGVVGRRDREEVEVEFGGVDEVGIVVVDVVDEVWGEGRERGDEEV